MDSASDRCHSGKNVRDKTQKYVPQTVPAPGPTVFAYKINNLWTYDALEQSIGRPDCPTLKLRTKTAEVLNLLIANNHSVVTSEEFFDRVWKGRCVSENVLKQSISELRNSLEDTKKSLIVTVSKQGYRFSANLECLPQAAARQNFTAVSRKMAENDNATPCPRESFISLTSPVSTERTPAEPEYDLRDQIGPADEISPAGERGSTDKSAVTPIIKPICGESTGDSEKNRFSPHRIKTRLMTLSGERLWWWVGSGLITVILVFLWNLFHQLQVTASTQRTKLAEVEATKDFYREILFRYYHSSDASRNLLEPLLDKSIIQAKARVDTTTTKLGMLKALFEIYRFGGHYSEARNIAGRIEKQITHLYGKSSTEYARVKFDVIDILIKLRRRREAFDVANATMELVSTTHPNDKLLLAKAHYIAGRAHLFCVAPYCERRAVMTAGERHSRIALKIYTTEVGAQSIEVADALWLLNWFILDVEEKVRLSNRALDLYIHWLGDFHEKTAAALEELGRTLVFWNLDWRKGEQYLLKAFEIRQQLYGHNHPEMATIQCYLAEHYFMTGQFESAIHHADQASRIIVRSLGESNDRLLKNLMLQARAQLYSGNPEKAKDVLTDAFNIIERHKMTPSVYIHRALIITQMRTDQMLGQSSLSYGTILNKMSSIDGHLKIPISVLSHEYLTLILAHFPEKIDERYLANLNELLKTAIPQSRYLYLGDIDFLEKRAAALCSHVGQSFCEQIEKLFDTVPDTFSN